jgi:cytoskeleton protein RodZ
MSTPSPDSETGPEFSPTAAAVHDSPGALLREARERSGLSLADIAARLRMGVRQVDALERGDYAALPTGMFLRGFVRNYAKTVKADAELAVHLLEQNNAEAARLKAASIIVPSQEIRIRGGGNLRTLPFMRIATVSGVVVLLAAAAWYWVVYMRAPLASNATPPAAITAPAASSVTNQIADPVVNASPASLTSADGPSPAVPATAPLAATGGAAGLAPGGLPLMADKLPATAPADAAKVSAPAAPLRSVSSGEANGKADRVLGFTFSGDSWVNVTDADGRSLLSRYYHAGEAGEISGNAPLLVVIGNAQVTRMASNGKEIELAPYTRLSVARVAVK